MNTMRSTWPGAMAGLVLIGGGGLLMNYETEVSSMGAQVVPANQLTVMINKLNQIAPVGESSAEPPLPAVDANNSSASRFVIAFPGAVLDKQTGLVWEEMPDATPRTWTDATRSCIDKTVEGTIGWRLPSAAELTSLQDRSVASPVASAGVFPDVPSPIYWSSAKAPIGVSFIHLVDDRVTGGDPSQTFPAWCVRGGVNTEQF